MNKTYSKHPKNIRFDNEVLEICDRYIFENPNLDFSTLVIIINF